GVEGVPPPRGPIEQHHAAVWVSSAMHFVWDLYLYHGNPLHVSVPSRSRSHNSVASSWLSSPSGTTIPVNSRSRDLSTLPGSITPSSASREWCSRPRSRGAARRAPR